MAKFNILNELTDPFGSKYLKKLDDIRKTSTKLLNPKRIDLLIDKDSSIESATYMNRLIDSLLVTDYIKAADKVELLEAEIKTEPR